MAEMSSTISCVEPPLAMPMEKPSMKLLAVRLLCCRAFRAGCAKGQRGLPDQRGRGRCREALGSHAAMRRRSRRTDRSTGHQAGHDSRRCRNRNRLHAPVPEPGRGDRGTVIAEDIQTDFLEKAKPKRSRAQLEECQVRAGDRDRTRRFRRLADLVWSWTSTIISTIRRRCLRHFRDAVAGGPAGDRRVPQETWRD